MVCLDDLSNHYERYTPKLGQRENHQGLFILELRNPAPEQPEAITELAGRASYPCKAQSPPSLIGTRMTSNIRSKSADLVPRFNITNTIKFTTTPQATLMIPPRHVWLRASPIPKPVPWSLSILIPPTTPLRTQGPTHSRNAELFQRSWFSSFQVSTATEQS